jgi:hypothetical protein
MGMTMITAEGYHDLTGGELGAMQAILDEDNKILVSYDFNTDDDGVDINGPVKVVQGSLPKTSYLSIYAMCDDLFDSLAPEDSVE